MKPPYDITPLILKLVIQVAEKLGEIKATHLHSPAPQLRKQNRIRTIQTALETFILSALGAINLLKVLILDILCCLLFYKFESNFNVFRPVGHPQCLAQKDEQCYYSFAVLCRVKKE